MTVSELDFGQGESDCDNDEASKVLVSRETRLYPQNGDNLLLSGNLLILIPSRLLIEPDLINKYRPNEPQGLKNDFFI